MQNLDVTKTEAAWSSLAGKVYVPHSEEEYHRLARSSTRSQTKSAKTNRLNVLCSVLVNWIIKNCFAHGQSLSSRELSIPIYERVSDHRGLAITCKCEQDQPCYIKS